MLFFFFYRPLFVWGIWNLQNQSLKYLLLTWMNGPINEPLEELSHWVWEPGRDRDEVKKAAEPKGALLRVAAADSCRQLGPEWTRTWGSRDWVLILWPVMPPLGAHLDMKELHPLLILPLTVQWSVIIDLMFSITVIVSPHCFKSDGKASFSLSLILKGILLGYLKRFNFQHQVGSSGNYGHLIKLSNRPAEPSTQFRGGEVMNPLPCYWQCLSTYPEIWSSHRTHTQKATCLQAPVPPPWRRMGTSRVHWHHQKDNTKISSAGFGREGCRRSLSYQEQMWSTAAVPNLFGTRDQFHGRVFPQTMRIWAIGSSCK